MELVQFAGLGGALLVINALVASVRKLGVTSRYLPIVSLLIGGALGWLSFWLTGSPVWESVVAGVVAGAAASGMYDVANKTVLGN